MPAAPPPRQSVEPADAPALHRRAMDDLDFSRDTTARAVGVGAVSGPGIAATGAVAVVAAVAAARRPVGARWAGRWLAAANASLTFTDLRDLLGASDGNLGVHARRLEDAGHVACDRSFDGRVPRSEYRLTDEGRAALARYVDHMEALMRATRER